ncbi:MAG: hypothetical protein D6724_06955 [Armatimonadetes bacterium]|nr:MAG: hypothetical protein D6724_06955 [Armatimonadota bacterium]
MSLTSKGSRREDGAQPDLYSSSTSSASSSSSASTSSASTSSTRSSSSSSYFILPLVMARIFS